METQPASMTIVPGPQSNVMLLVAALHVPCDVAMVLLAALHVLCHAN